MIIFDNKQIYELVHVLNLNKLMSLFLYWNLSVSLLQWQVDDWFFQWASQLVSLLQWYFSSMQWLIYSHRSIYQWINLSTRSCATSESATMKFSMQWSTHSHRFIYQWIDSSTQSCANSESATKMSFVNVMIYLLTSLYLSVNLIKHSCATSKSATMTSFYLA